ncbi:MAG: SUMF1/EgtB/PvdO family nonheme iron enzyme [Fimbriimonadaceae bacterium]|nr:SUMF1/EgtB/PvdO family nonheme iron enzyme [Chitinophagales bacterium]
MKKILVLLLILFSIICITSFSPDKKAKHLFKYGFKYIPAGKMELYDREVAVNDFYIFETEITNKQYAEFLNYLLKKTRFDDYAICKIDSAGWNNALNFENSYPADYHLTSEFADYPVVNISYEAANLFCDWLENKLEKKISTVDVRLPNAEEWIYAAKGGKEDAEYPWENISPGKEKDFELCNYNSPNDGTCLATNYAKSYFPNAYGLYNLSGNVAEMLNEKGHTRGGSWNSSIIQMKITAADEYKGINPPSPYIGFRPVAVIK